MIKWICNGYVIDPTNTIEGYYDIKVVDGCIAQVLPKGAHDVTDQDIDASGLVVAPGFIDLHVHLREPGFEHKETIATGTRACAKGGYTTVVCMPNTKPALDTPETIEHLKQMIIKEGCIEVLPVGTISMNIEGKQISDHVSLIKAGAVGLSDDGRTTMDSHMMEMAFLNAKAFSLPVMTHSEDHNVSSLFKDTVYPIEAETDIVLRDLLICEDTGGHLHVGHVSGRQAIEHIKEAKARGVHVTCEAAPHHFALNDTMIDITSTLSKVNPPIRSEEHRRAVVQGLLDGTIDVIATDHAPHDAASKHVPYAQATFGISGIETAFSVAYTTLVQHEKMPFSQLLVLMSAKPAALLKRKDIGHLGVGAKANMVMLDINTHVTVDASSFLSKGKNTPFDTKSYQGEVVMTLYQGKIVYQKGDNIC